MVGVERNAEYAESARAALSNRGAGGSVVQADFFGFDWPALLTQLPDPLLVVGNPPWVTNAALSSLESTNVPEKSNARRYSGLDALTGKSNFDISEWMLVRLLEWLNGRDATLAMLCKTAVARKVLAAAWKDGLSLGAARVYRLNALSHFGASVDACLLLVQLSPANVTGDCEVRDLDAPDAAPVTTFGYRDGALVASTAHYERWKHLAGTSRRRWRSGIKHDCGAIMELREARGRLENGVGEVVAIEPAFLYPMLKTSEVAAPSTPRPSRWMLVPQTSVGEDTAAIRERAPLTWAYLTKHAAALDRRGSSIYRGRPRFSIFGVGDYSFAPWKVVISGFYKRLDFTVVGPYRDKPVVLDDLSYFLACDSRQDAETLAVLLNSEPARQFYEAFVFWDAKRPVTIEVLSRLDLDALAAATLSAGVRRSR